jgi:hypothetical protein
MSGYDPRALFERLHSAGVRYVLIGGWAVNAHGYRRYTGDIGICPDPALEADSAYPTLAVDALAEEVDGIPIVVCSLRKLRQMKASAGRERDREDLRYLPEPD